MHLLLCRSAYGLRFVLEDDQAPSGFGLLRSPSVFFPLGVPSRTQMSPKARALIDLLVNGRF